MRRLQNVPFHPARLQGESLSQKQIHVCTRLPSDPVVIPALGKASHRLRIRLVALGAAAVVLLTIVPVVAYETDPYTNRDIDLVDSLAILDEKVNASLDRIATSWSRGENERAFVKAVFQQLGGWHWVDKLEKWAIDAPEIDKLPLCRAESVFAELPLHITRGARWALTRIMNVNGTYVGTDKIGHFLSQGRKFYSRYRRLGTLERAAQRTAMWEAWIWGRSFSAVFSNADLVANYEGFLFYRGLFNDDVVSGKVAMFRWKDGRPVRQRSFSWADHVNPFWDEMHNPNVYNSALLPYIKSRMTRLCDDYTKRPDRYQVDDWEALRERYRHVGLRDAAILVPTRFLSENCPN